MANKGWSFTDDQGSFESSSADKIKGLYFPLCNESLLSSITPTLHGDIKTGENSFLLTPVSRIDLENSRSSRNFWVTLDKGPAWSATGVSKDLKQIRQDKFKLEAGLLWHKVTRENKSVGLRAEILSFAPSSGEPVEIMQVTLTNISSAEIKFTPTAAIPIYGRSAHNLRDHRHVTSLLQRVKLHKFGVVVKPTLLFDESGHKPNKTNYFVLGWDEDRRAPRAVFPTQEMFCGESGDLEAPEAVYLNNLPEKKNIQGKEAMGGLRFAEAQLAPDKSRSYIIVMGVAEDANKIQGLIHKFAYPSKITRSLMETKRFWVSLAAVPAKRTGDSDFDNWLRWVSIQPVLRRIFGCSYLPDFDYGKGGRGWRDLWQDCLALILKDAAGMRGVFVNNFSGTRIDGSNATIIGKRRGEFIADRNNISRVWMDHGVWPLITLDLYLDKTKDINILFEETTYFRDRHLNRCGSVDSKWHSAKGNQLKDKNGRIVKGSILEHLLVQSLAPFFNVGPHNYIRLEGGDWNDGLDMAKEQGESVAFSSMYARNLLRLSELLIASGRKEVLLAKELGTLLKKINYSNSNDKRRRLKEYFAQTQPAPCGEKARFNAEKLAESLKEKAEGMMRQIREKEWLKKEGFFNGYYDNKSRQVEGRKGKVLRMSLASQVFPIMSGVALDAQVRQIIKNVRRYLFDSKLKGFHLNTDFKQEQPDLGRAFSFAYGEKENGAIFNHMAVMYAYALCKRGFIEEGQKVLYSIYNMATDTSKSKIYPCLPEYFNLEGRGMYSYLTGSASWFLLTLLTQVFPSKR
jgi:cellobiose phosphorylase